MLSSNSNLDVLPSGTTLQPQISNIEASASEITVTYSLGNNVVSNAAAADHDRLRSLTLNYNLKSVLGTLSPVPVSAQTVTRVGSQIAAIFPVPANEELQPFLIYEMQMSLAVRGLGGPSSDTRTFIRGLQGGNMFISHSMSMKPGVSNVMIWSTSCLYTEPLKLFCINPETVNSQ